MKDLEKELEIRFNRNQVFPKLTTLVQKNQEIQDKIFMHNLDVNIAEQLCVQLIIHKRMDYPTAVGLLYKIYKDGQLTATKIVQCVNAGLCFIDTNQEVLIVKYNLDENQQRELDTFQFPLPLVVEPKKLTKNSDTGYYIADTGSLVLNSKVPKYDINLEHLNRVNKVKFNINLTIASQVDRFNKWKTTDDISRKNHEKFNKYARNICQWFSDKVIRLTHKYDRRGRWYPVAYPVNYQGDDWQKACVELTNKEIVK